MKKTIHLVESFTNYDVTFYCGMSNIDFRLFYLDIDTFNTDTYTSTTSQATCKDCLEKAKNE